MRKVSRDTFNAHIDNLKQQRKSFVVEKKRSVNAVYYNNKLAILNKNSHDSADKSIKKAVINLFAQVHKGVNNAIKLANFTIEKIPNTYPSTRSNKAKFLSLKNGSEFWYIDVRHCYWRIAFLKGYISENLYKRMVERGDLKVYRNMSLACIVAPKVRQYYRMGIFVAEISEDKRIYRTVYDNIRFTSYNLMGEAMKISGRCFIGYRTDGIMVTKTAVPRVKDFLKEQGFDYTVTKCTRIDSRFYRYGTEIIKKF